MPSRRFDAAELSRAGCDVRTAASGEEALALCAQAEPQVILLDLQMPGISGLELQQKLASRGIRMPVIIVTGHGDVPMAVRAMKAGALDFIEKPFSLDGLLHVTDMTWGRLAHPSDLLQVGQELQVLVLEIDKERLRVSLGLKQLSENPWDKIAEKYPVNLKVRGKVTSLVPYGAFVQLEPGVEGLVHISELSPQRVKTVGDVNFSIAPGETTARLLTFAQLVAMLWLIWESCRSREQQAALMRAYVGGAAVASGLTLS